MSSNLHLGVATSPLYHLCLQALGRQIKRWLNPENDKGQRAVLPPYDRYSHIFDSLSTGVNKDHQQYEEKDNSACGRLQQ